VQGCASRLLSRQVQPVKIDGTKHSLAPAGVKKQQNSQHCIFAAFHFNRKGKQLAAPHILYFVKSIKTKPDVTGYYRKIKKNNPSGLLEKLHVFVLRQIVKSPNRIWNASKQIHCMD
jgi:hypothetical protein